MSGITLAGGPPGGSFDMGDSSGRALKLQTDVPHLVSMGGDRLSTSVTLHHIPPGRVTLGCGSGVDIPVQGTGVLPLHCHIENSEGVVTIYPLSENLSIDGVKVTGPTRLSQGVMLTIGRSNYMRFNHPVEAKLMKSVLPNPRISMAPITFEPADVPYQPKFNKKPPTAPRKSPRESLSDSGSDDAPSSIMTKVSKFEYLAAQNLKKAYSPKVFSSNVPTVNMPVKDVLGKDLNSLKKNLPQSALNYADLNYNDKEQNKNPGQPIFARRQPQYVNVELSETKTINNRVMIYENGCVPKKNPNVSFDHNDLSGRPAKNVNVFNKINVPSPSFNRNPSQYNRSVTPSPASNNIHFEHRRSGSVGELSDYPQEEFTDLEYRKREAELRRNQAQKDRISEQRIEKAEQQRLEEILNMCAEYEKQSHAQSEKTKPVTPNRIITNGSLPRDKRHLGPPSPSYSTPPSSPLELLHSELLKHSNHNYENPHKTIHKESVQVQTEPKTGQFKHSNSVSPYENISIPQGNSGSFPSSPRTRIKTFVTANNGGGFKDASNSIVESKFAVLETEKKLLREAEIVLRQNLHNFKEVMPENLDLVELEPRKTSPTKFIFPLDDIDPYFDGRKDGARDSNSAKEYNLLDAGNSVEEREKFGQLKKEKKEILAVISRIKRQMAEIEIQEEELRRELELEKALINGEYKSKQLELQKIDTKKQKLTKRAQRIEESMRDCQMKQDEDQKECKKKLQVAQENMNRVEDKLKECRKGTKAYDDAFEEYLQAQEQLDNERKTFEDLEFHHLEEEADWLATREELQREIVDLSNRMDDVRSHLQDLDDQRRETSNTNYKEYKAIEKQKMECMVRLEEIRNRLKFIDGELLAFSNHESDKDLSSGSDSDLSGISSPKMSGLSCSLIVGDQGKAGGGTQNDFNMMSQSFNEKLFEEKTILECAAKKFPSQDDIDRISKVTSDAPIIEGRQSLGKKTIESLKEIERIRHLHLCEQGSQVIEQERQRVLALKQRVQEEVKSKWAEQQERDRSSSISSESNRTPNRPDSSEDKSDMQQSNDEEINVSKNEDNSSPRPLSEVSEMSLEVGGGTLNRKRTKPAGDKQRPLTRYLPIRGSDLDLRQHIESAGHQVVLCPHVTITSTSCRGFLHKKGSKLNGWSRRWFVFDRSKHTLTYYSDKSEKKTRGGAYFQAIEEVYLDHLNSIKSPNPQLTFVVKTHERFYYLMAPSPESMRIWVDVIFTGAEGYREFDHGT
ncbi:pleckstrin homology-like domain family B member 1 isoform X2 [Cylas formicarius]|uniref:pleckstrin homology-like domain family B member 1 isoform X2 n=1 Tax=Cylas formicarius TaxID=197179 RepID=UPI0029587D41|nr:pleckstrin homology-like domain family B member 1 isoform X2 [Cylas formicarius]